MVLDTSQRNSLRAFGMLICLFGDGIATAALGAAFKARVLQAMSSRLWALMGLLFAAFVVLRCGSRYLAGSPGKVTCWSDWFQSRRTAIELGPIDVFPPITPQMRKEALAFTIGFLILVCIAAGSALIR